MDEMVAKMIGRLILQMITEQFADSMKTKSERIALLDGIIQQATIEKERLGIEEPEPEDYDKVLEAMEKLIN